MIQRLFIIDFHTQLAIYMTTIGEANGKSSTFTINSYPDRLCGLPVISRMLK